MHYMKLNYFKRAYSYIDLSYVGVNLFLLVHIILKFQFSFTHEEYKLYMQRERTLMIFG